MGGRAGRGAFAINNGRVGGRVRSFCVEGGCALTAVIVSWALEVHVGGSGLLLRRSDVALAAEFRFFLAQISSRKFDPKAPKYHEILIEIRRQVIFCEHIVFTLHVQL